MLEVAYFINEGIREVFRMPDKGKSKSSSTKNSKGKKDKKDNKKGKDAKK